jgi:hypothetical protein
MKFETQTHQWRFILGVICGLLPVACILFGWLGEQRGINPSGWHNSISATYFSNARDCMAVALGLCSFFLFTYKGYDIGDRAHTLVAAVSAALIVVCPCAAVSTPYLGLFALPAWLSDAAHMVAAITLFGALASMTLTQFTKGKQKRKNMLYCICGWTIVAFMVLAGLRFVLNWPAFLTMVFETGMLWAFSVAWIVKSGALCKTKE